MTPEKEFVARQIAPIIKVDLKNHTSTMLAPNILRFSKGQSAMGRIDFILHEGRLIVTGDYDHAIYVFGLDVTFARIAEFELNYFASKTEASPVGRGGMDWSESLALQQLGDNDDIDSSVKTALDDVLSIHGAKSSWDSKLAELHNDGHDVYAVKEYGKHIHHRTALHLEALKLAIGRLV